MNDSVVKITVAGFIGAVIMNLFVYLVVLLGVNITFPWQIAADIFLATQYITSILGTILGLIGTLALNIAGAILVYMIFKFTGYDYATLKGVLALNGFSFISMGLFMPLLRIAPQVQNQPLTNIMALVTLTITGAVMGLFLRRFMNMVKE